MRVGDLYPVPKRFAGLLPGRLRPLMLHNDPEAWKVATAWLSDFPSYLAGPKAGGGLVLFGPAGTGKTTTAASFLNFLEGKRQSVAWLSAGQLERLMRVSTHTYVDDADAEISDRMLYSTRCVVVDDVLRVGGTSENLEAFMRTRHDSGLPTVVTLNNGVEAVGPLRSFLAEFTWATFAGPDLRDSQMEAGDLGAWEGSSLIAVLEGVLCEPQWEGRLRRRLADVEQWGWSIVGVRTVQRYAFNNVPVEVVTFLEPEIADHAAAWFSRYDVSVASVEAVNLDAFCRSLAWRHGRVQRVVDSDADRLSRYGQIGYQSALGQEF